MRIYIDGLTGSAYAYDQKLDTVFVAPLDRAGTFETEDFSTLLHWSDHDAYSRIMKRLRQ